MELDTHGVQSQGPASPGQARPPVTVGAGAGNVGAGQPLPVEIVSELESIKTRKTTHDQQTRRQLDLVVGVGVVGATTAAAVAYRTLSHWPADFPAGRWTDLVLAIALCACLVGGRGLWRLTGVWRGHCPPDDGAFSLPRRVVEMMELGWLRALPFPVAGAVIAFAAIPPVSSRAFLAGFAAGAGFLATGMVALRLSSLVLDRRKTALLPLDALIVDLDIIAAHARRLSERWYRPDVSRFLINRLEALARKVELLRATSRAPIGERALREVVRDDYIRLAWAIRRHKTAFANVHNEEDHVRVTASLETGLQAMLENNWTELLANVPPLTPVRRWRSSWPVRNLLPALLLSGGAVAVPSLPPFADSKSSALGVSITLGIYAVLRLIPGQKALSDLFDKGIERTMSTLNHK